MSTNNLANEIHSWVNTLNIHASKSAELEAENESLKKRLQDEAESILQNRIDLNNMTREKNTLASDNDQLKREIVNLKNIINAQKKISLAHEDQKNKYAANINTLNETINNLKADHAKAVAELSSQIEKRDTAISVLTDEIDGRNQVEESTKNVNNADLTEFIKDHVKNAFDNLSQGQWYQHSEHHKSNEPAIDRTNIRVNLDAEFAALYQACAISHAVKSMEENLESCKRIGVVVNAFSKHIDTIVNTITEEKFVIYMVNLIFYRPMNELMQIYTKLGLKIDDILDKNNRFEIIRAIVGIDGGVFFEALKAKMTPVLH